MNIKNLLAASALCLTSLGSNAGVVYEWHSLTTPQPQEVKLRLEFDESVVNAGSIRQTIWVSPYQFDATSPLISMRFGLNAYGDLFYYSPRTSAPSHGSVTLNFTFGTDGLLRGGLSAYDWMGTMDIASTGSVFTVRNSYNDNPLVYCAAGGTTPCFGALGEMRRVEAAIPEPGSLALLGLGLAAALGARRRRFDVIDVSRAWLPRN
jgi:hypothetical protein